MLDQALAPYETSVDGLDSVRLSLLLEEFKLEVLATVAAAISALGSNIENVSMEERDGLTSTLRFVMTVKDRKHLAHIMRHLRPIPSVLRIARLLG